MISLASTTSKRPDWKRLPGRNQMPYKPQSTQKHRIVVHADQDAAGYALELCIRVRSAGHISGIRGLGGPGWAHRSP
eukprot:scaffold234633_cov46-Prasinocladus_malaysianus.AAC.1